VKSTDNIYLPHQARIIRVVAENAQIKTFELAFTDSARNQAFSYRPGQFMMVSIPHHGEAPISIASTPTRPGSLELSVRQAGHLTTAMHAMAVGDLVGLRGPYGRPFPVEACLGRDLVFVAGGIGLAPLRSLINFALDNRRDFGAITLLYGSRSPQDIAFSEDIRVWRDEAGVECLLTVDLADPGWQGAVGLVTTLLDQIHPDSARATGICCGPSVMIRAVLAELVRLGFSDDQCLTTLERHMKCGVGVCRHCHLDSTLVCVDGPVFTLAQLRRMGAAELA
jgi:NAD(P)H-flavin reductase